MKLILNVKITGIRIGYPYDTGRGSWTPKYDRFEIFRYCLASYAVLAPLVSKFHFYIQLADDCAGREAELEPYINELFPQDKLDLRWYRNNHTRDWRQVCEEHLQDDNEVIWFAGNDDHIFIDYNLDMVRAAISVLQNDSDPLSVVYYSHWPEQARMSHALGGQPTEDGNFVKYQWQNYDGIHMFKAARFKRYWYDADYGDDLVFRPDDLNNHYGYNLPSRFYAPTREMVRHYDGYVHIGRAVTDIAPTLFIPPGFFEKDMTVRIGFTDRDNACTNFNASSVNLYNTNPNAADYRWIEDDIPLFWRDRIKNIIYTNDYNESVMIEARNRSFINMSRFALNCFGRTFTDRDAPPEQWFNNHLRN